MTPQIMLFNEEERAKPITKVVAEHRCQKINWKGHQFTYQVNQNITRDTFSESNLAEVRDSKADQELEISIRDCIQLGVLF